MIPVTGSGNDTLVGLWDIDNRLRAGGGDDYLEALGRNDWLNGNNGDDVIVIGGYTGGGHWVLGAWGNDTYVFGSNGVGGTHTIVEGGDLSAFSDRLILDAATMWPENMTLEKVGDHLLVSCGLASVTVYNQFLNYGTESYAGPAIDQIEFQNLQVQRDTAAADPTMFWDKVIPDATAPTLVWDAQFIAEAVGLSWPEEFGSSAVMQQCASTEGGQVPVEGFEADHFTPLEGAGTTWVPGCGSEFSESQAAWDMFQ